MIPILITTITLLVTALIIRSVTRVRSQGVVTDFWNKYRTALYGLSMLLVVSYFGVPSEDFEEAFGNIGSIVQHVDLIVGLIGQTIILFGLKEKKNIKANSFVYESLFDEIVKVLIIDEGGYTDDKDDSGNWTGGKIGVGVLKGTMMGISAARYPNEDIKNLTVERVKFLYKRDFWNKHNIEALPREYQHIVFDMVVNHNPTDAFKAVQRAINDACADIKVDGKFGHNSRLALNTYRPPINLIKFRRIELYEKIIARSPIKAKYRAGWINRAIRVS